MRAKSEKGIAGIDYVTATVIFVIGSIAVMGLYLSNYKNMAKIKIDEMIIGRITEICETIDILNYENVDTIQEVNYVISNADIPSQYSVVCESIEKLDNINTMDDKDIVEKVNLRIEYNVAGVDRNYLISKIKVKE